MKYEIIQWKRPVNTSGYEEVLSCGFVVEETSKSVILTSSMRGDEPSDLTCILKSLILKRGSNQNNSTVNKNSETKTKSSSRKRIVNVEKTLLEKVGKKSIQDFSSSDIKRLKELYSTKTYEEIGRELNTTFDVISNVVSHLVKEGLLDRSNRHIKRTRIKETIRGTRLNKLIKMYESGNYSYTEIANALNVPRGLICSTLKKLHEEGKTQRKNKRILKTPIINAIKMKTYPLNKMVDLKGFCEDYFKLSLSECLKKYNLTLEDGKNLIKWMKKGSK